MNNLEWYYHIVQKYREGLTRINTKFDEKIKAKAGYKGSAQYEKDIAAIEKGRMGEIAALRADCGSDFDRCLASMSKNAKNRPAVAPTEEQLRLIQLLKLKKGSHGRTWNTLRTLCRSVGWPCLSWRKSPVKRRFWASMLATRAFLISL